MPLVNMTVTAEEEVLRWARVRAAEDNTSVSRLVGDLLKEKMTAERQYAAAREEHFSIIQPVHFSGRRPSRDQLYDRGRLR